MDYRSFSPTGPQNRPDEISRRWWELKGEDAANSIASLIAFMTQNQSARFTQQVISARLYGNLSLSGIAGITKARVGSSATAATRERANYNLVQSVIDTTSAKIGENRPKPYFLTSGGDYKTQRKAKKLNQFVDGMFYELEAYDLGGEAWRDALIWGDGLVFVYPKNERVCAERVLPAELYVDEAEGQYGQPRSMHRVKLVDREELLARFPNSASVIARANRATDVEMGANQNVADMVQVRESWHLPSGPDASDGKHVVSIDGHLLIPMETWHHDFFPFARWRWCPRPFGFWSQGLAEQLQGTQIEINKLLYLIQRSYHLGGSFKVFLAMGSKVVKEHLNNDVGSIVMYTGQEPKYVVPPLVPPEVYQHLELLIRRGYEQAGINLMSATGNKPAGLNSGKALREYKDEASERGKTASRHNERGFLDLAMLCIATARDIAEENRGHYKVTVPGKAFLQEMDWADIDLEDDEFVMQCFPVSSLPSDPAGRLQTVQEYIQAGFLTPRQGKKLMDFPDLDRVEGLQTASEDILAKMLDAICDDGEASVPEPTDDLDLAKEMVLEYIARGRIQGLDEERMGMLRAFSSQVDMLKQLATPPAPPPGAPGMGAPQANPAPPPVSDLLPNAPSTVQ